MYLLSVTITTTNVKQPIIPAAIQPASSHACQGFIPYNNGANQMYLGDSRVTVTPVNYIPLFPGGSLGAFPAIAYANDLNDWWVIGTAGDVLTCVVFP